MEKIVITHNSTVTESVASVSSESGVKRRHDKRFRQRIAQLAVYAVVFQVGGCAVQATDVASYQLLTYLRSIMVSLLSSAVSRV